MNRAQLIELSTACETSRRNSLQMGRGLSRGVLVSLHFSALEPGVAGNRRAGAGVDSLKGGDATRIASQNGK
jgi:hypothetical protein